MNHVDAASEIERVHIYFDAIEKTLERYVRRRSSNGHLLLLRFSKDDPTAIQERWDHIRPIEIKLCETSIENIDQALQSIVENQPNSFWKWFCLLSRNDAGQSVIEQSTVWISQVRGWFVQRKRILERSVDVSTVERSKEVSASINANDDSFPDDLKAFQRLMRELQVARSIVLRDVQEIQPGKGLCVPEGANTSNTQGITNEQDVEPILLRNVEQDFRSYWGELTNEQQEAIRFHVENKWKPSKLDKRYDWAKGSADNMLQALRNYQQKRLGDRDLCKFLKMATGRVAETGSQKNE